ncbi:MAG: hypothetical protein HYX49_00590 [Chloroflexi bacterium]|nr:hypothetical protein [Chloroflexota bacterium]
MSTIYKYSLLTVLIAATLACGLITTPISNAKNLASTAQAIASSMPIETLQALPSSMPDVGGYANPTGQPVSDWNGIPIMPAASVGQEFNQNTYSFKVKDTLENAQTFYNDNLKALGWTSAFSAQGGTQGGVMLFTKGSSVLSITVTETDGELLVLLITQ